MAGRKLFTNQTPYELHVTLVVRRSEDPRYTAGTTEFSLTPAESRWEEYGDAVDIYLNGMKLVAMADGARITEQHVVISRGSRLDDELNTRNGVDFGYVNQEFYISTRQVG